MTEGLHYEVRPLGVDVVMIQPGAFPTEIFKNGCYVLIALPIFIVVAFPISKIFIPFFTTKKRGSGIGLSLSRQIMRKHQGVLAVKTKMDEGTEFMMRF